MLDHFLKVACETNERKKLHDEMVADFMHLPIDELSKIAGGFFSSDEDCSWLDQFEGSELYEEAIALEQQALEIQAQENAESAERLEMLNRSEHSPNRGARDAIALKKKVLALELRKQRAGVAGGAEPPPMEEEAAPPVDAGPPPAPPAMEPPQPAGPPMGEEVVDEVEEEAPPPPPKPKAKSSTVTVKTTEPKDDDDDEEEDEPAEKAAAARFDALLKLATEHASAPSYRVGQAVGRHHDKLTGLGGAVTGAVAGGTAANALAAHPALQVAATLGGGGLGYLLGRAGGRVTQGYADGMAHAGHPAEKQAAARFDEIMKQAGLGGAVMAGLKGAGSFAAGAGKQMVGAAQRGGLSGLGANAGRQLAVGAGKAANFAKANPLAAGAIGAGALGTAAVGGAALGRASG